MSRPAQRRPDRIHQRSGGGKVTLEGTLWHGNAASWGGAGTIEHTGDYTGTPAFLDPEAGDYHIDPSSAAIDRGVDTGLGADIDGQPRPQGPAPDLGADETGLVVVKQARPRRVQAGEQVTFIIRVTNTSPVDLHATITDTLPVSLTLLGTADGTLVLPDGTVLLPDGRVAITWTAVLSASGGAWTETLVARLVEDYITLDEGYGEPLVNVVEVTTEEGARGTARAIVNPHRLYLPVAMLNFP